MQLKAAIQADRLQAVLKAITAIATECLATVGPDGMAIKLVDPASVAMADITVPAEAFDFWDCPDQGAIALEAGRLQGLVEGKGIPPVSIEIDGHEMKVSVGSARYTLRMLSPDAVRKPPRVPEIDLPAWVEIDAQELRGAVKAAINIAEKDGAAVLETTDDKFLMHCSTETEKFSIDWPLSAVGRRMGMARSLFSLDYLDDISKVLAGPVLIELGVDYPGRMTAKAEGGIKLQYLLAPRIENT